MPFPDTGLTPNTHYYYKVAVLDSSGMTGYSMADAYMPPALANWDYAVAVSSSEIDLNWVNNGDSSTVFQIERMDPGSSDYQPITTTDPVLHNLRESRTARRLKSWLPYRRHQRRRLRNERVERNGRQHTDLGALELRCDRQWVGGGRSVLD